MRLNNFTIVFLQQEIILSHIWWFNHRFSCLWSGFETSCIV